MEGSLYISVFEDIHREMPFWYKSLCFNSYATLSKWEVKIVTYKIVVKKGISTTY
jgi:hypothetical protein